MTQVQNDNTPYKRFVVTAAASVPNAATGTFNHFIDTDNTSKLKSSSGTVTTIGGSGGGSVSDDAYGAGWNGVTGTAPSQNAVYDKIQTLSGGLNDYIKVSDTKAANTQGGTFTSGADRTRDITTEDSDTGGHCSIASNQITLAAGTYICSIKAPARRVAGHQAFLYNVTDAATTILGTVNTSPAGTGQDNHSFVNGKFTIATSKVFEVRHTCTTTEATAGFGAAINLLANEIYTVAEFWKVA